MYFYNILIFGFLFFQVESKLLRLADIQNRIERAEAFSNEKSTLMYSNAEEFIKNFPLILDGIPSIDISLECIEDMTLIFSVASNQSAVPPELAKVYSQILDASAKQPPGVQRGAQNFYGFKQECDIIRYLPSDRKRELTTSYSRAYMNAYGTSDCGADALIIGFDVCLPKSCSSRDLNTVITLVPQLEPNSTFPFCSVTTFEDINEPMSTGSWIMVSFLIILASIGLIATVIDYFLPDTETMIRKKRGLQLFLTFSLYTNISEILSAPKNKKGQIGPLNCLRAISILWIMLSHTVANCIGYTNNALDYIAILDYPMSEIIENSWFSVDTFFFISGLLLGFMWFKGYERNQQTLKSPKAWILFYVHRFIRLSAPYYVLLLCHTYLSGPILQDMPLFFVQHPVKENICKKYLWKNLLYIFNFNYDEECLAHAWYLATDLQIFILTPLILIPLALKPVVGLVVAGVIFTMSTAGNVITVYVKDFPATQTFFGPGKLSPDGQVDYTNLVYYAFWIRCQVYIIGMIAGWFLQRNKRLRINPALNFIFWLLSAALMLTVIFGLFHYFRGHQLPIFWRAAYSSLSRPAWALGLAWIIISCYYGYGGPINRFMSWNIWAPLGKLTFCAYLVHYPIINYLFGLEKNPILFSSIWEIIYHFYAPLVGITGVLALLLSALVEVPVGKLESMLLRPSRSHTEEKPQIINSNNVLKL